MPGQGAAGGVVSRTAYDESSAAYVSKTRTLCVWLRAGCTLSVRGSALRSTRAFGNGGARPGTQEEAMETA